MKKIICAMLLCALAGCTAIVREDQNVKGIGMSQEKAQAVVDALDSAAK
ncbi:MAG: hypothetical protein NT079_05465 [Candidatus Omnitrophica bacterium]|nr:hypothetical protein [Candidatus Omnitrophota bacterium]